MTELLDRPLTKSEFYGGMTTLKDEVVAELCTVPEGASASDYPSLASVREAFDQAEQSIVRERILGLGKRPDGRGQEPAQVIDTRTRAGADDAGSHPVELRGFTRRAGPTRQS